MANLRAPGLGPIVGHTTDKSCRIWIRAGDPEDEGANLSSERRTVGVIAVVKEGQRAIPENEIKVFYFRLHREYDRTGTFNLGDDEGIGGTGKSAPLKPGTDYEVRVGTLTLDDPYRDDKIVPSTAIGEFLPTVKPEIWWQELNGLRETRCVATFRTFAKSAPAQSDPLSFILGSCRYPGLLWKVKEADQIFGPLLKEAQRPSQRAGGEPAKFALMVGDQIYADMLNRHVPVGLADTFEEFQERYHTAFGSHNMRKLLRQLPTYMILDDHEIEDNWHQDRIRRAESRRVFNLAMGAYMSYQWSHCPRTFGPRLYYTFECGGYPFFVLDTRTQRFMDDIESSLQDNHMLGRPSRGHGEPSQLERLLRWLEEQHDKGGAIPKFIVSSSVFAPNPMAARTGREKNPGLVVKDPQVVDWMEESDSWPGFPETRRAILRTIVDRKIQNVVFLSGDIHCSNVAELSFARKGKDLGIKAFSITSSAFYWPFFFADGEPSGFVHDSKDPAELDTFPISDSETMDYRAWNFTQEDNFCRVDVDPAKATITVCPYDYEGNVIHERDYWGTKDKALETTLHLKPWKKTGRGG